MRVEMDSLGKDIRLHLKWYVEIGSDHNFV